MSRICHVITRMNIGGAEENTLLTCLGLLSAGHEVTLVTGLSSGAEGDLLSLYDVGRLEVVTVPELVREISPGRDLAAYRRMRRLFAERGFDVVHTHMSKAGVLGRLAASAAGVPLVCHTVHGLAFHGFQSRWKNLAYRLAERVASRCSQRIYAVAESMIRQCVEAGVAPEEKFLLVRSGMVLEDFLTARRDVSLGASLGLSGDGDELVVGVMARMFPQKGYEDVLEAMPLLARSFPGLRFLFLGDGDLRPELERRIGAMGLTARVILPGMVPPREVCRYLPFMSVLLHLSYHEGLPRTVVQALAAGVPAIAYPVDGTPEVLEDGVSGYLVPLRDTRQVAEKASVLLRSAELRRTMGAAGRAKVRELFSVEEMVRRLNDDYAAQLARLGRR
ncbi:MAG: glycosyltransferase family 4 protein [Oligosphaeraceae bacterium]